MSPVTDTSAYPVLTVATPGLMAAWIEDGRQRATTVVGFDAYGQPLTWDGGNLRMIRIIDAVTPEQLPFELVWLERLRGSQKGSDSV
jgi:hypothetical protein